MLYSIAVRNYDQDPWILEQYSINMNIYHIDIPSYFIYYF